MRPGTRAVLLLVHRALSRWEVSLFLIIIQIAATIYTMRLDSYFKWMWIPLAMMVAFDAYRFTVRFLR